MRDYHAESINLENKSEAELLMAQNVLITIDEFDRLSKKYQADLKYLIQKPEVKVRRPHQKTFQQMRRLASFAATANPMELLTDPTGSRRHVCVQVTGIIDVSVPIEYEQLYAQALHAIRSGERYWLNSEEERALTRDRKGTDRILYVSFDTACSSATPCQARGQDSSNLVITEGERFYC